MTVEQLREFKYVRFTRERERKSRKKLQGAFQQTQAIERSMASGKPAPDGLRALMNDTRQATSNLKSWTDTRRAAEGDLRWSALKRNPLPTATSIRSQAAALPAPGGLYGAMTAPGRAVGRFIGSHRTTAGPAATTASTTPKGAELKWAAKLIKTPSGKFRLQPKKQGPIEPYQAPKKPEVKKHGEAKVALSLLGGAKPAVETAIKRTLENTGFQENLMKSLGRYGPIIAMTAGAAGIAGLYNRSKAEMNWPHIRDALKAERGLSPDEEVKARNLFNMIKTYGPDLAKDKQMSKSMVSQMLPMADEGMVGYLTTIAKTQKDLRDIKSPLSGPIGLATQALGVGQKLLVD